MLTHPRKHWQRVTLHSGYLGHKADDAPIGIHNGLTPWCSPLDVSELIEQVPGHLCGYTPKMKYFLLDESVQLTDRPEQRENFAADLIDLECSKSSEDALKVVKRLGAKLRVLEHQPLAQAFKAWIQAVLVKRLFPAENIPKFDSFEEVTTVLEERVDQWREDIRREALKKGLEQGIEQGIRKAQIDMLGKQAEQRFGSLTPAQREQLAEFEQRQLDVLCSRIFTAKSLDELLQVG